MQLKKLFVASASLFALATSAGATITLHITNVAMNAPTIANFSGPGISENVEDSVLLFTTGPGSVTPFFCVDIWHPISLGPANLTYRQAPLTTNSSGSFSGTGTPLTSAQIGEIGGLAHLGEMLITHGGPTLAIDLSGIQAAIWAIENPAVTVSGSAQLNSLISQYESYAMAHPSDNITAFYNVNGTTQGVVGVPEPAAWSLMLLGFGVLGANLRATGRKQTNVSLRSVAD